MADQMPDPSPEVEVPVTEMAPPSAGAGIRGFLATTTGKVVVIGGAVLALLLVVGAVSLFFMLFMGNQVANEVAQVAKQASKSATSTGVPAAVTTSTKEATTSAVPTTPPAPVTLDNVFTFRDPFVPVLKPLPPPATSTAAATSTATTTTAEANTLTLQDTVVQNGVRKAVLIWEGTTYTLGAGEQIAGTPWAVLSVGDTTVTMLFGDEQVVLSVGEGIQK
jgi:hypothetical protein